MHGTSVVTSNPIKQSAELSGEQMEMKGTMEHCTGRRAPVDPHGAGLLSDEVKLLRRRLTALSGEAPAQGRAPSHCRAAQASVPQRSTPPLADRRVRRGCWRCAMGVA